MKPFIQGRLASQLCRRFAGILAALPLLAPSLRADTTVSDGSVDTFAAALATTITNGGGTILVTTPIVISSTGSTNGIDADFDGESIVRISGGNTNSIFLVVDTNLSLANFTVSGGLATNGGAMYISPDGNVTLTNCVFSNNVARGADGVSADPVSGNINGAVGKNGGRGTSASPASGGAIFNLGSLAVLNCQFVTNSAIGGLGGNGADGTDAGTRGGNGGGGGNGGWAVGGGIYNGGTLLVSNSTFAGNLAEGGTGGTGGLGGVAIFAGVNGKGGFGGDASGGGLYTGRSNSMAIILNSTFSQNTVVGGIGAAGGTSSSGLGQNGPRGGNALGGGVDNAGMMNLTNCTFFENIARGGTGGDGGPGGVRGGSGGNGGNAIGGGIYNTNMVCVVNCTFNKGGAIGGTNGAPGTGVIVQSSGHHGGNFGGNIANVAKKKKNTSNGFFLANSIIGTNLSGGGAYGTITDEGFNIIADKTIKLSKSSTSKNLNPLIGDLADNGGPTETIALPTNSPAVDFIPPENAPSYDQRGAMRPMQVFTNDWSDAGAYELDLHSAKILTQPQSTNVAVGTSNVTFTVTAGGDVPLSFQWFFNQTNEIPDATNSTFVIASAQTTNQGTYDVVVTNSINSVTSKLATLTVFTPTNNAPQILSITPSQTVLVGTNVIISVTATGTPPLTFQWIFQDNGGTTNTLTNNATFSGVTSSNLSISNVQTNNSGIYYVIVSNSVASVMSLGSSLTVATNANTNGLSPGSLRSSTIILPQQPMQVLPLAVKTGGATPTFNFTFSSQIGATYVVEYKRTLTDPDWIPIFTNSGTGNWLTNQVPMTNPPSGFYRVVPQ
jgi:hypothetical protein